MAGTMTLTEYLDQHAKMKDRVLHCEQSNDRFRSSIPMPDAPPDWAKIHPLWLFMDPLP
jgi:hypothetical protein